jgi:hypothetical protein
VFIQVYLSQEPVQFSQTISILHGVEKRKPEPPTRIELVIQAYKASGIPFTYGGTQEFFTETLVYIKTAQIYLNERSCESLVNPAGIEPAYSVLQTEANPSQLEAHSSGTGVEPVL